jgi:hypothetical protein
MSPGEIAFLGMVIFALCVFAVALAYASWVAGGNQGRKLSTSGAPDAKPMTKLGPVEFHPTVH